MADGAGKQQAHAQAVRFLTTLHAQNGMPGGKLHLSNEQRDFLRAKGLSDDAIEQARQEAERPESAALASAPPADLPDTSLFDFAAHSFDAPVDVEVPAAASAPVPPPASYPRSPLALYSNDASPQRDASDILAQLATSMSRPRYDTLVLFFRVLHMLLLLGGGLTGVGVVLYRHILMPRLGEMLDARKSLVLLQRERFERLLESVIQLQKERVESLLPPGYEPTWVDMTEPNEPAASDTEVQNDAPTKTAADDALPSSDDTQAAKSHLPLFQDVDEAYKGTDVGAMLPRRELAPIDITQPLRSALGDLTHALRQAQTRRTPSSSVTDEGDEGLMDLGVPGSPGSAVSAGPSPSLTAFRASAESMRNDLRAKLLSDEESMSMLGSRFSAFAAPRTRPTSGPAVEMQQMKAEIRSLKGLFLSR